MSILGLLYRWLIAASLLAGVVEALARTPDVTAIPATFAVFNSTNTRILQARAANASVPDLCLRTS